MSIKRLLLSGRTSSCSHQCSSFLKALHVSSRSDISRFLAWQLIVISRGVVIVCWQQCIGMPFAFWATYATLPVSLSLVSAYGEHAMPMVSSLAVHSHWLQKPMATLFLPTRGANRSKSAPLPGAIQKRTPKTSPNLQASA